MHDTVSHTVYTVACVCVIFVKDVFSSCISSDGGSQLCSLTNHVNIFFMIHCAVIDVHCVA